jgi:hypothetical protein
MKKLTLFAVLVVLAAIAMPAMAASTLGVGGELSYGMTSNGTTTADAFGNGFVNFTFTVDPNNMVVLELWPNKLPTISNANGSYVGSVAGAVEQIATPLFYLKSDLASAIMMDPKTIDPVLYAGFGNATLPGYGVTDYGIEDIAALGIGGEASGMNAAEGAPYPYVAVNTSVMGMVNILLGASSTAFGAVNNQAVIGAYGTFGPVSVEAGYSMNAAVAGLGNGTVSAGALVNEKLGDLAINGTAQVVYYLAAASSSSPLWSAGVSASYQGNYGGGFAIANFYPKDNPTGALKATANVDLTFAKNLGVNVGAMLNLDPNAGSAFDTVDVSAWTTLGATKLRVGYLYGVTTANNLGTPALEAYTNNGGLGGVYFTTDLSF